MQYIVYYYVMPHPQVELKEMELAHQEAVKALKLVCVIHFVNHHCNYNNYNKKKLCVRLVA